MNPETAVTCNRGHFNQVFFAVQDYLALLDVHVVCSEVLDVELIWERSCIVR